MPVHLLACLAAFAIALPAPGLELPGDDPTQLRILTALDSLLVQIDEDRIDPELVGGTHRALSQSMWESLPDPIPEEGPALSRQVVDLYRLGPTQYSLSLAYLEVDAEGVPGLRMQVRMIAVVDEASVRFSIPLAHLTRYWDSETVGRIRYFHRDGVDRDRAEVFDRKNGEIAARLGLRPEEFDLYLTEDYQEILFLLGFEYDRDAVGTVRNGYGVDANTIFAIQGNEDFSHDVFHYYSGQIHERSQRNGVAEEGVAYSWGNAYWTDPDGAMVEQEQAVRELRRYLEANPEVQPITLFDENHKGFTSLAPEISARSTMASVLVDEVERRHGVPGILQLVTAGRRPAGENFLRALEGLLDIDRDRFDDAIRPLLAKY